MLLYKALQGCNRLEIFKFCPIEDGETILGNALVLSSKQHQKTLIKN